MPNISKKWTDQCEVCDLKKKKVTVRVKAKEKAPTKKNHQSAVTSYAKRCSRSKSAPTGMERVIIRNIARWR